MRIRPLQPGEAGVLLPLWAAADTTPSPTDTIADIERAMVNDRLACLVAEIDGTVVGSIIAAFDGWRGNIYRLAVHPDHRRRGIARQLVRTADDVFARWGVRRITALVEKDHAWAVSFWVAIGYSHDARTVRTAGVGRIVSGGRMRYMVIEQFRNGDALPVYRRFRDQGRLAPRGLRYVASWVTEDIRRCFQILECDDPSLLAQWTARWEDLVEFEIIPVLTSAEAVAAVAPRL